MSDEQNVCRSSKLRSEIVEGGTGQGDRGQRSRWHVSCFVSWVMTTASQTISVSNQVSQRRFFWANLVFLCGTLGLGLVQLALI
jgi:hypothetical protein